MRLAAENIVNHDDVIYAVIKVNFRGGRAVEHARLQVYLPEVNAFLQDSACVRLAQEFVNAQSRYAERQPRNFHLGPTPRSLTLFYLDLAWNTTFADTTSARQQIKLGNGQ
jgi:hypothetical protein